MKVESLNGLFELKLTIRHSKFILLLLLCISFILLFSCNSSNRLEGYVYYRMNAAPTSLDPALIVDVPSAAIAAKLFNGLVRLDENLDVVSDIAEKWQISADGRNYRFVLKKNVKFSSGRKVRAADFKYSFERIMNPGTRSPNTWVFEKVEGAGEFRKRTAGEVSGFRVIDDHVFEIRLKRPFSPFLSMLTTTPCYVVPEEEILKWKTDFSSHPTGTGPFILQKWLSGGELTMKKNSDYFDGKAKIRGIVYKVIPEDLTAITEFELGNLDAVSLPASAYSNFLKDKKWRDQILSVKGLNTYYLGLNSSKHPFNNPELRKAVAHAIDRKKVLATFYEGRGMLAAGPVPDLLRKWDLKEGGRDPFGYDPEFAGKIVHDAGKPGIKVDMYVTADQDVVDLSEIIQSYLSRVGIRVNIKQLEWSAYKDAVSKGEPDMFWLSWWADYPDPENFLFPLFHSSNFGPAGNRTRYINKEVDALIEKGQYAANRNESNRFYQKAENIIVRDAPWVPFWHRYDFIVKQPWLKGYRIYPIYSMDKGIDIEI